MRFRTKLLFSLPLFAAAGALQAAAVDPRLFQELQWRLIGPFRGGRVLAVAGVPGEPQHFYFGAVNGGVWETTMPAAPGSRSSIAAGRLDRRDRGRAVGRRTSIYVGTGEADMRSDIAQGNGMYKSADGGRTLDAHRPRRHAADRPHPRRSARSRTSSSSRRSAIPTARTPSAACSARRDGGTTLAEVLWQGRRDTGAIDLAFEPGNPSVIYAALWQTRRTPWNVYPPSNGPGSGLYKSTDGGDTWTPLTGHGFPAQAGRIGIAVAPANRSASTRSSTRDERRAASIAPTTRGANWRSVSGDARIWQRGWYFGRITVDPKNADASTRSTRSCCAPTTAARISSPLKGDATGDDFHELWIDPDNPTGRSSASTRARSSR